MTFGWLALLGGIANAAVVATVPGSFQAGYVPPAVVIAKGEGITYANGDVAPHNFVAASAYRTVKVAKKTKWCSGFKKGKCPLFWSQTVGMGKTAEVEGLELVTPGKQYAFLCTLHPNMKGTLIVR